MANNDNGGEKKQLIISHNSVGKTESTVVALAKQTEVSSPKGATEEAKAVPEEPPTQNNSGRSMTTESEGLLKKSPP